MFTEHRKIQCMRKPDFLNLPHMIHIVTSRHYAVNMILKCGPGTSDGIATDYGLDGPGSNPGGGEIFRTCSDRPWGPPSLL